MILSPHVESSLFLRVAWMEYTPEIAELSYIKFPDYQLTNQGIKAGREGTTSHLMWSHSEGVSHRGASLPWLGVSSNHTPIRTIPTWVSIAFTQNQDVTSPKLLPTAMSGSMGQLQLGFVLISVTHVTSEGSLKLWEMKSGGHAGPAPPFAGPGKAGLASCWTL